MSVTKLNVARTSVSGGDVVGGLRRIAAAIESGHLGADSVVVVAHRHGEADKTVWALGNYDSMQTLGILHRAIHQVNRDIS